MDGSVRNQEGWNCILSIYPEAFLYHEYKDGGFWFYKTPEDRETGNSVFYVKNRVTGQYEFKEHQQATPAEGNRFFTDHIADDCYWWVPGELNDQYDSDDTDMMAMADFMFRDTGLELLFEEADPTFDAFTDHLFTKELWHAIRQIAEEKGGIWRRCLLETDAWAERTFKRFDYFTLRTV